MIQLAFRGKNGDIIGVMYVRDIDENAPITVEPIFGDISVNVGPVELDFSDEDNYLEETE